MAPYPLFQWRMMVRISACCLGTGVMKKKAFRQNVRAVLAISWMFDVVMDVAITSLFLL